MRSTQEFTNEYHIRERYYLLDGNQMVERIVSINGECVASEAARSCRESGDVCLIVAQIKSLRESLLNKRSKGGNKISSHTNEFGNAIYVLIRIVFRLKLLQLKFEALKFDKHPIFYKGKTSMVKEV